MHEQNTNIGQINSNLEIKPIDITTATSIFKIDWSAKKYGHVITAKAEITLLYENGLSSGASFTTSASGVIPCEMVTELIFCGEYPIQISWNNTGGITVTNRGDTTLPKNSVFVATFTFIEK